MFNDIKQAISYIESKRTKRTFLMFKETVEKYHFNIHQKNMIHIAGTNGKGSTTTFIRDLLMQHGYRVGTFTSPYIVSHNERMCINGKAISDERLLEIINEFYEMIEKERLSMFEIDVLIMLKYFDEEDLDYRIIECGIGGLNDKTNVIDSCVSVITNIGYDHQFMLGNTLSEIALQKAGIIKEHQMFYTTEQNQNLLSIFKDHCHQKETSFHEVKVPEITHFPYQIPFLNYTYTLNHGGSYQVKNALLALYVCHDLIELDTDKIQTVLNQFNWPGRFERFGKFILDGAHNQDGIQALIQTIQDQKLTDVGIVFSALNDKDIDHMLAMLKDFDVMMASFDDDRSNHQGRDFKEALSLMAAKHQTVVVTGSLHFISTVRKYVENRP
ncbi:MULTISPECIES: folylpolyglutamate synthase/dihydrofolate synthase family protein [Coprobacillaceae]|uniref:bifunctional folylpolyglutamate synthase/dihydrofolate synthase n=1 Tax=Coprobacillaceae TaxID=2810280 RepID=UPI000E4F25CD|nr:MULTISPECIES: Mur ligase family protein [Coprobacillaceae]RHM61490.1 hypothetical protein DWZ53_04875 [Coprobacillus sp. AF33-1AC]RHS93965.1 hypothetical protein DW911_05360 [Erysipelatoclostridium sp. AM42-17]